MPVTPAQARAIVDTIARIESPESPCLGLKSWHIASVEESMLDRAPDEPLVEVHFRYLPEHLEVAPLGLEVTVFDSDGRVIESQDLG